MVRPLLDVPCQVPNLLAGWALEFWGRLPWNNGRQSRSLVPGRAQKIHFFMDKPSTFQTSDSQSRHHRLRQRPLREWKLGHVRSSFPKRRARLVTPTMLYHVFIQVSWRWSVSMLAPVVSSSSQLCRSPCFLLVQPARPTWTQCPDQWFHWAQRCQGLAT